jgi:hypothetical protein
MDLNSTTERNAQPRLAPAIQAALGGLRGRIHRYAWSEGGAAAVVWLAAAFWATLAMDWFFEPSVAVRAVMLAAVGFGLAVVLFQWIGRRLLVPITNRNAATVLERRFPQFGDSLLTAVALSEPRQPGGSAAFAATGMGAGRLDLESSSCDARMLARTCQRAADCIANVDLDQVFERRPLRQKYLLAGLLVMSVAFFGVLDAEGLGVWARRMFLLSHEVWPRQTRLEIEGFADGACIVARGSDLEVVALADTRMPVVPQIVELRYRAEGGNRGRATMDRRGAARGGKEHFQEYAYTFRGVLADIHFDILGGDDRVADRWIRVVDSPTVAEMTLDCVLPAYIGRAQLPLPVSGVMQLPAGSRITVRAAAANKDLTRVRVAGMIGPRAEPLADAQEAGITADRRGFHYPLPSLMQDVTLLFTLTDTDGIKSRDPVRLVLTPLDDQPPRITVRLDGIGTAVTATAKLPVIGTIADDYGIDRVWFEYATEQEKLKRRDIRPIRTAADDPTEWQLADARLELRDAGLKPGQKLAVSVKASDRCDLGKGPNIAAGERWILDVVTPDQLRRMLESRELVLRQRFDRLIEEMTETRDVLAHLSSTAPKPGDAQAVLPVESALTNCRKSTQEVLGLGEAFDDICKQLVNNRIDTEEMKNRLKGGIAAPLRGIGREMFPELEHRLEGFRAVFDDAAKRPGTGDRARRQADAIVVAMRKIRDRMIELEDFNEALGLLRGIIQGQEQVREQTQRQHKEKIRDLLKD